MYTPSFVIVPKICLERTICIAVSHVSALEASNCISLGTWEACVGVIQAILMIVLPILSPCQATSTHEYKSREKRRGNRRTYLEHIVECLGSRVHAFPHVLPILKLALGHFGGDICIEFADILRYVIADEKSVYLERFADNLNEVLVI